MLQQGVKHMRINPVNYNTILIKNISAQTNPKTEQYAQNSNIENSAVKQIPSGYFVSFYGYREDKNLIQRAGQSIDNMMEEVIEHYQFGNPEFETAINHLKYNNPAKYELLISRPETFKNYELKFNDFNATTLKALDDIRYSDRIISNFWEENSKTGKLKTANIIRKIANSPNQNINEIIKNSDEQSFKKIKDGLILSWFNSTIKAKEPQSNPVEKENSELIKILKDEWGVSKTYQHLETMKANYFGEFNRATIDKILSSKTSNDEKMEAFNSLLSYIEIILTTEEPAKLHQHLQTIASVRNHLNKGINKESLDYVKNDFIKLHDIAINHWNENDLSLLINNKLKKDIIINKIQAQNPEILNIPGYEELPTDEKYFTAKYYEMNQGNKKENNMLKQVIEDRNISDPSIIIDTISLQVDSKQKNYFDKIDNFYNIINNKEEYSDILEQMNKESRNDVKSFINRYFTVLGNLEQYQNKPADVKLNYLEKLTQDELRLAGEKIKPVWIDEELKYSIEREVRKQANLSSINQKMYDELCKININLNDIKIKINEISFSLKDLLDNKYLIKNEDEIKKITQNASTVIADAERNYYKMTPAQRNEADEKMKETLPHIIDNLIANAKETNDTKTIEELTFIKTKCKNSKTPARDSLGLIKAMVIGRSMSLGMHKGCGKLNKLIFNHHNTNPAMETADIADNIHSAGEAAALSAGTHAAVGSKGGFLSAIPSVDPYTLAAIAAVVAVSSTILGAYKATQIEKTQREIYVDFTY